MQFCTLAILSNQTQGMHDITIKGNDCISLMFITVSQKHHFCPAKAIFFWALVISCLHSTKLFEWKFQTIFMIIKLYFYEV